MPPDVMRGEKNLTIELENGGKIQVDIGYVYMTTRVPKPPPTIARIRLGGDGPFDAESAEWLQLEMSVRGVAPSAKQVAGSPAGEKAATAGKAKSRSKTIGK